MPDLHGVDLASVAIGDFDGDGAADVFFAMSFWIRSDLADTDTWWTYSYRSGSKKHLGKSAYETKDLVFGDFNGDGKTDVFSIWSNTWYVAYGGTSGWILLNGSAVPKDWLLFGDFNGDGKTDVFTIAYNKDWMISYGGISKWINRSGHDNGQLAIGDFNGDGRSDVFAGTWGDGKWHVSYGGITVWKTINECGYKVWEMDFVDMDGDGKVDLIIKNPTEYCP